MSTTELTWTKSSYSGSSGDDCVEVAATRGTVHIRDSKDIHGPRLAIAADAWATFLPYAARRAT
ncbi:DUF397 domain-containing protein [Streptomyces sp. CB02923]|uniref:DUF397 domain-containing protein n=1 Tax=Streptomyces sp. CB02923 TaxID=1718985 RepID=UPI00093D1297|nr:DUF397 domain-containing protein [Streptomyces sp. CB02923]OKI05090.1 DUF397 domain-containing protein [Streptomyces sp. CB02923]